MARFTAHVLKPGGRLHLVGDDDSGRFIKLAPVADMLTAAGARACWATLDPRVPGDLPDDAEWPAERHADHRGLLAMAGALLGDESAASSDELAADAALVRALSGGAVLARPIGGDAPPVTIRGEVPEAAGDARTYVFPLPDGALEGVRRCAYPQFGLYLWRGERIYLAVRCGGQRHGSGGHAHADHLALELAVDGVDWIADPGSFLYTALPEVRDRYRSVAAHFAPRVSGREPMALGPGPFSSADQSAARCLRFDGQGFAGTHEGYGIPVYRQVEITDTEIRVTDWARGAALEPLEIMAGARAARGGTYADGYGRRVR
ncbi:MAG TPA: heparinase II/III family protein, partial [Longimicrobium sp.]|nr:heparinase II/III family protein [Longimicrobium sp.]